MGETDFHTCKTLFIEGRAQIFVLVTHTHKLHLLTIIPVVVTAVKVFSLLLDFLFVWKATQAAKVYHYEVTNNNYEKLI